MCMSESVFGGLDVLCLFMCELRLLSFYVICFFVWGLVFSVQWQELSRRRMSLKLPILCWVGHKTLTFNFTVMCLCPSSCVWGSVEMLKPFVFGRFFDALLAKETRRSQRYFRMQMSSFDISKNEFLCPLCETISNTVLPLMPPLQTLNKDR